MSKKILITGGTGYIGSHTVVELQNAGFDVIIIDNLSNSDIEVLDRIKEITWIKPEFIKLDLTDATGVADFFKEHGDIDSVIHFAALKAVGESVEKPLKYYRNNILGLVNLLEGMGLSIEGEVYKPRIQKDKRINFIFSSSCAVYGQPDELPVTEKAPIKKAGSPYGNTKQIAEDIITDTAKAPEKNINAIFLRYFNPIGAHESGLIGELPKGTPANLVPYVTQTSAGIRECVKIYGNDYPTPDGTGIRDYIHVVDLAKAHVKALKRLLDKKNKSNLEIFNLGTGKGSSVLEIIKIFERVNNIKVPYKIVERRPGDIADVWADTSLANQELNWQAEKSLEDALRDAWNWEKRYRGRHSGKECRFISILASSNSSQKYSSG
ncbi:MAG: UDP-glucose 4-epimerase GalE [bacterium]